MPPLEIPRPGYLVGVYHAGRAAPLIRPPCGLESIQGCAGGRKARETTAPNKKICAR